MFTELRTKLRNTIAERDGVWLTITILVGIILFYGVIVHWLFRQTMLHEQLSNALSMLFLAGLALITEKKRTIDFSLRFTQKSNVFLFIAFMLAVLSRMPFCSFAILPSCGFAISAWLLIIFGERLSKVCNILVLVFVLYSTIVLALPYLDWPLRSWAGGHAAWLLEGLGHTTELQISGTQHNPNLLLVVDQRPFHVAAECNGYGIISSSALIALLLLFFERISLSAKLLYWFSATCMGYIFNVIRIVAIVQLAPYCSGHYHFMHESVGYVSLIACLLLVWYKLHFFTTEKPLNS